MRVWLKDKEIDFTIFLCKNDFILHNSQVLKNQNDVHEYYDVVISNPPYFKLPNKDERAIAARSVIFGQTNIYTIFLLIATKLLREDGQLIFITPRSFCSGNYFRLFREIFFFVVDLKAIHLFNSRKAAFKRDKVLQENIIIEARLKRKSQDSTQQLLDACKEQIIVSSSTGIDDIKTRRIKKYECSSLLNLDSYQKILFLPTSEKDEQIIKIFKSWAGSLKLYDLEISTGPVVDFRIKNKIKFKKGKNTVPLFWLKNVESMKCLWPLRFGNNGNSKGQYILSDKDSKSKLVQNRNLVFLRRFSSKDDKRRLIAAPYLGINEHNSPLIGIENHLNYIYHKTGELTIEQTIGLAAILNSQLFDRYFRTFNGNINVSATELRDFPLPNFNSIEVLGKKIRSLNEIKEAYNIDSLVTETLNLTIDLS